MNEMIAKLDNRPLIAMMWSAALRMDFRSPVGVEGKISGNGRSLNVI